MPIDHNLPHDLDDQYGPGAEDADTEAGTLEELEIEIEELEIEIEEELVAIIGDVVEGKKASNIKDCQPPESVIEHMAKAAAQVLIAFERGYRMD